MTHWLDYININIFKMFSWHVFTLHPSNRSSTLMILFCYKLKKVHLNVWHNSIWWFYVASIHYLYFFCLILVWGIRVRCIRYGFAAFAPVLLGCCATKLSTWAHLIWWQLLPRFHLRVQSFLIEYPKNKLIVIYCLSFIC